MYRDPVSGIRLATQNSNMVVTARFRSSLKYKISRLCICLADNIRFLPLIGSSVTNCRLHSLILITVDHCPGNKTTTVKTIRPQSSWTLASICWDFLNGSPARILSKDSRLTTPEISNFTYQRISSRNNIYTVLGHVIANALADKTFRCSNNRTKKFTVCLYIFLKNGSVLLRNVVLLNIIVDLTVSIRYLGDILFISDDRIHFLKDLGQICFTGWVHCKRCLTAFTLLININSQDILPVTYQQCIIGQFIFFFIFFLDFIHNRCKIIRKCQIIIILKAVQIKIFTCVKVGDHVCHINRISDLSSRSIISICNICSSIIGIILVILIL